MNELFVSLVLRILFSVTIENTTGAAYCKRYTAKAAFVSKIIKTEKYSYR